MKSKLGVFLMGGRVEYLAIRTRVSRVLVSASAAAVAGSPKACATSN